MPRKRKLNDDGNADIKNDMDVNDDKEYDLDGLNKVTESCLRKLCQAPGCTSLAPRGGGLKGFCIAHGGGKRCQAPECTSSAQGTTSYCIRHRHYRHRVPKLALEGSSSSSSSLASCSLSSSSSPVSPSSSSSPAPPHPPIPTTVTLCIEIGGGDRIRRGISHDLLTFYTSPSGK